MYHLRAAHSPDPRPRTLLCQRWSTLELIGLHLQQWHHGKKLWLGKSIVTNYWRAVRTETTKQKDIMVFLVSFSQLYYSQLGYSVSLLTRNNIVRDVVYALTNSCLWVFIFYTEPYGYSLSIALIQLARHIGRYSQTTDFVYYAATDLTYLFISVEATFVLVSFCSCHCTWLTRAERSCGNSYVPGSLTTSWWRRTNRGPHYWGWRWERSSRMVDPTNKAWSHVVLDAHWLVFLDTARSCLLFQQRGPGPTPAAVQLRTTCPRDRTSSMVNYDLIAIVSKLLQERLFFL